MSLRLFITRFVQHGRILFRSFRPHQEVVGFGKANILPQGTKFEAVKSNVGLLPPPSTGVLGLPSHLSSARKLFVDNVLKRVTNSLATELRRKTTNQLLNGNSAPFFALVGVSLASGTGILTKEDELDGVCWEIRDAVSKMHKNMFQAETEIFDQNTANFEKLEIGPKIAKGSNAVVYAARIKDDPNSETFHTNEPVSAFPYAVKMMFNYDAESNASSILRSMYCETVPARVHFSTPELVEWEKSLEEHMVALPPHPNIVAMHCVFADWVPAIPGALADYPDALPARLNPDGSGRNMSLFLLMKRYDCSLKDYISEKKPEIREAILLLTQLLEAVAHMNKYRVAHRDLKSDNVLLDLSEGRACPMLAITDFGCCLADKSVGLSMPFRTLDTNRGGNAALMAPEVACATPGIFTYIDYSKSDVWTVGTMAYELLSDEGNPFYRGAGGRGLRNTSYEDSEVPQLGDEVPPVIARLVRSLLARNPNQRPNAEVAATVCQLFLWAPTSWLHPQRRDGDVLPSSSEILQWLLCLTTKVLCENLTYASAGSRRTATEYQLIACFLHRAKLSVVRQALAWIHQR